MIKSLCDADYQHYDIRRKKSDIWKKFRKLISIGRLQEDYFKDKYWKKDK